MKNDYITNSSISTFKACRQKYYFAYEMGWRPDKEKSVLRIGSMVHEGLDQLAKGADLLDVLDNLTAEYATANDDYETLAFESVTVQELVRGYAMAWSESQIRIIESEKEFCLPIINENGNPMTAFKQAGKRDRLCELPDGRIALMETKTVSEDYSAQSDARKITAINHQISMYIAAAKAEGIDVQTTIYDTLRKPTIKPCPVPLTDNDGLKVVLDADGCRVMNGNGKPRQTADTAMGYVLQTRPMTPEEWRQKLASDILERPEYYYQRFEVPRLDCDLERFNIELSMVAKDILECRRRKHWYRNTNNCRMYSSICPYYPLCSGEVDAEHGCPQGFRQSETFHEELATIA